MPRLLCTVATLVLLAVVAGADGKQQEGEQLITRALEQSNIRAAGAPSFRMKASFRAVGNSSANQGTYTETWASREEWRRETDIGSFHRIEVGGSKTKWLLDSDKTIPSEASAISAALSLGDLPKGLKIKRVENKDLDGVPVLCVRLENQSGQQAYCVDPKQNTLLLRESFSSSGSHFSYLYGDYQKFADRLFPRSVRYQRVGHPEVEISVSELVPEPNPDASQFAPLAGALELTNCLPDEVTPPRAELTPEPEFPTGAHGNHALVVLQLIIAVDGMPHDIQVVQSGGTEFDVETVRAVERWRFKPPKCRGESVAAPINVEVNFQR